MGFAQTPDHGRNINGIYWSPGKDAKIEIYENEGRYFGKTIWIANPGRDQKNPERSLRGRDLLGLVLLSDFKYDGGGYSGGSVYDPKSGKTYDCKITIDGNQLKVRGYVGISLFGRTEYFQRIR